MVCRRCIQITNRSACLDTERTLTSGETFVRRIETAFLGMFSFSPRANANAAEADNKEQ